ncbi:MAG: VOC family protein, partial [Pseudomonadota bacterium]
HFAGHPNLDPSANPAGAYILSSNVDQLSRELAADGVPNEGVPRCHSAETKAWGMRELEIVDPDGNLLRIGQRVDG